MLVLGYTEPGCAAVAMLCTAQKHTLDQRYFTIVLHGSTRNLVLHVPPLRGSALWRGEWFLLDGNQYQCT